MITDPSAAGKKALPELVKEAVEGGADVVQLRDKTASDEELVRIAKKLLEVTRTKNVPLIINDRAEVAKKVSADGVHLGQDDGSLASVRELLGEEAIIGRSTHSREQALDAQEEGFDYIGVGPVFGTPTKPTTLPVGLELVHFAAGNITVPFVAIGGIDRTNIHEVLRAGAKAVAVVRAVMSSKNPRLSAQELLRNFS